MAVVNKVETRNYSAISKIDNVNVMSMNANYNTQNDTVNFSQTILNIATYEANKEAVDADYETWKADILANLPEDTE